MHRPIIGQSALCVSMDVLLMPRSDHQLAVGLRLRRAIRACEMQYKEAAEIMGVSPPLLGNWMRGDAYPHIHPLYRFCRSTGVSLDYLILGDPSNLPKRLLASVMKLEQEPADL